MTRASAMFASVLLLLCALAVAGCAGGIAEGDVPTAGVAADGGTAAPPSAAAVRVESPRAAPVAAGRILVKFRAGVPAARRERLLAETRTDRLSEIAGTGVQVLRLPPGRDEQDAAETFRSMPEVKFAEVDQRLPVQLTPNDTYYGSAWHLPKMSCPSAWNVSTGSPTITVAICDTGTDGTHPDLAAKMVPGWNASSGNTDTSDVHGHGTATAGTATALGNNGTGVASVSWSTRLMPIRVTNDPSGYAYTSDIASGLTWAADHGARVANISYGVSTSATVTSAAQYFQGKGGVVTVSAGNESTVSTAADNPYVLTVSATDQNDAMATWSNTGSNVDLAAPGVSILTTNNGGAYGYWSGTSFSAPLVAGVAALVLSTNPSLTGAQVQDVLKSAADDLGPAGWDAQYGYGRVNAARAVNLALGSSPPAPPTVSITCPATVSGTVNVGVSASSTVGIASVDLSVDGQAIGTDTTSPYAFSWNTTTLGNGAHTLTAVARDLQGTSSTTSLTVTVSNTADTTAPSVSITSPKSGATVSKTVKVYVSASDNVGVVRVDLYVDGALTQSSTTAPFTTTWNASKAARGSHTLVCKARDAAGNVGTSAAVTVYK